MLSGLSYPCWFVTPAFILLSQKKQDPFMCFHAIQGLFFGAVSSLATLLVVLGVWIVFHVLPPAGGTFSGLLGVGVFGSIFLFVSLLFFASIFIGWQASSGRFLKLPLMGEWAEHKMVEMLELDYEEAKNASASRVVQKPAGEPNLEPIPFPAAAQGASELAAARINPDMAAQYARQLLQQPAAPTKTPPPAAQHRPTPPPRPAERPAPTPARGSGSLPAAFQRPVRPSQPPAKDSSSDDSLSARRWLPRGDSSS